jgi:hypothetical protein
MEPFAFDRGRHLGRDGRLGLARQSRSEDRHRFAGEGEDDETRGGLDHRPVVALQIGRVIWEAHHLWRLNTPPEAAAAHSVLIARPSYAKFTQRMENVSNV